jgi:hypothetical protein
MSGQDVKRPPSSKIKKQQKRLSASVQQAKANRADLKKTAGKNNRATLQKPPGTKPGGFFTSLAARIFGRADKPQTAQQSIPYREMYRDGICRVTDRLFTKTILFGDINYHLAQNDDKTMIFEHYCDLLNYFDSSIGVQISAVNRFGNAKDMMMSIDIAMRSDENDSLRMEYSGILKNQQAKGNNGLVKTKYITFGIEADNLKTAKMRAERVEADVLNNFKILGVPAKPLNGAERLEVMHGIFHPGCQAEQNPVRALKADGNERFIFNWKDMPGSGLSTKDGSSPYAVKGI